MPKVRIKGGKAALINPETGQSEWVQGDLVPQLLQAGWSTEDPGQVRREVMEDIYGGLSGEVAAAGLGVLRGASLGMSDILFEGLGGVAPEFQAGLREANPVSAFAGEVGGMLAGGLIEGPLSGVAAAGRGVGGLAARGAVKLGAKEGGKLAGLASRLAGGATEGGLISGAMGISEPSRDPEAQLGDQFRRMGEGMLLGAGLNVAAFAASGLGKWVGQHNRRVAGELGIDTDALAVASREVRMAERQLAALQSKASTARQEVSVLDDQLAAARSSAKEMHAEVLRAKAARQKVNPELVDALNAKKAEIADLESFRITGKRGLEKLEAGAKEQGQLITRLEGEGEAMAIGPDRLQAMADSLGAEQSHLADKIRQLSRSGKLLSDEDLQQALKLARKLRDAQSREAQFRARFAQRSAERGMGWAAVRALRGRSPMGTAGLGGGVMGAIGGGPLGAVIGFVAGPVIVDSLHKALWMGGKALRSLKGPVGRVLNPVAVRGAITMNIGEYEDLRDELTSATPDQIHDRATLYLPGGVPNEVAAGIKDDTIKSTAYLHSTMPKSPLDSVDSAWKPSPEQMNSWARRIRATVDRESPLRDLARMQLSIEAKETFSILEPEAYYQASAWVEQQVRARLAMGQTVPRRVLEQVALFTGKTELGPQIDHPAVQAYLQSSFQAAMAGGVEHQPTPSQRPSKMGQRNLSRLDQALERTQ